MSAADSNNEELDRQLEEAVAAKSSYDDWKMKLAGNCLRSGESMPNGFHLQRLWNEHQRNEAAAAKFAQRTARLKEQIRRLNEIVGTFAEGAIATTAHEDEELDSLFANIDADIARQQESITLQEKAAKRQQEELFSTGRRASDRDSS